MFRRVLTSDLASLVLRLALGAIFLGHGLGKVEHGAGAAWEPLLTPDTQMLIAWGEVALGVLILLGLCTRVSAAVLAGWAVATGYLTLQYVPFLGSEAHKQGANYDYLTVGSEFQFALVAMAVALVVLGGGVLSLDAAVAAIFRRQPASEPSAQDLQLQPAATEAA